MAEFVRIRLEFRNFANDMKSMLFVYKKSDNQCIKQLSKLIQNRWNIKHNISLFIDGFLLQNDETIEAVRDNDLIVVEPEKKTNTKSDTKPKPKSVQNAIKAEKTAKPKNEITPKQSKHKSQAIIDSSDSLDSVDSIQSRKKQKLSSSDTLDAKNDCIDNTTTVQQSDANIKIKNEKTEINEESNELNDDLTSDVYSNRNTPLRKAFKAANKCLSEREPVKPSNPPKNPSKTTKRKPLSREAREPVDKFSPIIPLKDLKSNQQYCQLFAELDIEINGNKTRRKQSARKTFPTPSNNNVKTTTTAANASTIITTPTNSTTNTSTTTINNINIVANEEPNVNETIEMEESNANDYNDCEPLAELPNIGDLIAFKLLIESKTSGLPEASNFQKGSVINRNSNMIDVLIENNNNNDINDTTVDIAERRVQILKIDWSTVIEPKIIQRQHLLLSDSS